MNSAIKKQIFIKLFFLLILFGCSKQSKEEQQDMQKDYLFEELSKEITGVEFINTVIDEQDHSIINYIYYYNGGGVAAGDVNGDALPDLFFVANTGDNKLFLNKGNLEFEDVTETANIGGNSSWSTGVTMVDINQDGLLDIYVCAVSGLLDFTGHNELFINNGDGTFTEDAKSYGLDFEGFSTQAYFFDYDKDDDLDVYIVNHAIHTNLSHGEADLRNKREPNVGDVLLKNDNGKFVNVSESANIYGGVNGYGLSATIADFNNDGWDDIYVCNDFHEDDYYYINNQDGTFSEQLGNSFTTISRFSMGSDAADLNRDGYQDLITLDMLPEKEHLLKETEGDDAMFNMQAYLKKLGYKDQFARNMLQINHDGQFFSEEALYNKIAATDWSWGALFADYNNDMHQDLFISNGILRRPNSLDFKNYVFNAFKGRSESEGLKLLFNSIEEMPSGIVANKIFEGNSNTFSDKTGNWITDEPQLSNGAIYVDLDLDGDLDIVTNNLNQNASVFKNKTKNKNYINLKFNYKAKNREGIGTKASVFTEDISQLKQLFKSRGFMSSLEGKLYFGLDNLSKVDSIQVIWPNNEVQMIYQPEINSTLLIDFEEGNSTIEYNHKDEINDIFKEINVIDFVHKEENYNDFAEEKLIPYRVSNLGPAVSVADVNNNGYKDIFIGNAAGKPAQLLMNTGFEFKTSTQPEFVDDMNFEDNKSQFLDVDNDGDLDLYVGSGLNKNENYRKDRLYINENNKFVKSKNLIPDNNLISSSVVAYDYDNDGDLDLFVGNYTEVGNFGKQVDSYILVNDGKGRFTKDPNFKLNSKVTSAEWQDVNNDGQKDLIITTEWDKPYIFINTNGVLTELTLPPNLNGLWQTSMMYDIDEDGDLDILLGNWGLNTKFNLYFDGPLLLLHSDFDKNGKEESIVAYNRNGNYYPLNTKAELASQMNAINKKFLDNKSFAGKTIQQVFGTEVLKEAERFEVHELASGYLLNENGQFNSFVPFPKEFQLAPITSFTELEINQKKHFIVGGNSNRLNTYHGKYVSLKGLLVKNIDEYDLVSKYGIEPFHSQITKIESIEMKNSNLLIIITNNDEVRCYSY